jgi:hypothetical protein
MMDEKAQLITKMERFSIESSNNIIGLREYYGDAWNTAFSTIEEVNQILSDDYFSNIVPEYIISRHSKGENVIVLNVRAPSLDKFSGGNVFIYINSGAPTWEDYADITYGDGKTADLRVLVFNESCIIRDSDTVSRNIAFLALLADHNRQCSFPTALLVVRDIKRPTESKGELIFTHLARSWSHNNSEQKQLPTRRELLEADFIFNYYDRVCGVDYCGYSDISFDEFRAVECYTEDIRSEIRWDDNGLYLSLVGVPGSDEIKWVWDKKERLFGYQYRNCPITLHEKWDEPYMVTVRRVDFPMKDLIEMPPVRKMQHAEMLHDVRYVFSCIIQEALSQYREPAQPTSDIHNILFEDLDF